MPFLKLHQLTGEMKVKERHSYDTHYEKDWSLLSKLKGSKTTHDLFDKEIEKLSSKVSHEIFAIESIYDKVKKDHSMKLFFDHSMKFNKYEKDVLGKLASKVEHEKKSFDFDLKKTHEKKSYDFTHEMKQHSFDFKFLEKELTHMKKDNMDKYDKLSGLKKESHKHFSFDYKFAHDKTSYHFHVPELYSKSGKHQFEEKFVEATNKKWKDDEVIVAKKVLKNTI